MFEKFLKGGRILLEIAMFVGLIVFAIRHSWIEVYLVILNIFLVYFSKFTFKKYKIILPIEFEIVIVSFLYASFSLGEAGDFYGKFHWWDTMLHTLAGIVTGFIGFLILYVFYKSRRLRTGRLFIFLFAFSFSMMLGAVWEIFEFSVDQFAFGGVGTMQPGGNYDTMIDLVVDALGALFASYWGVRYLENENLILGTPVRKFVKRNARLFAEERDELDKKENE